jgi:uncharacterized protein YndB with AHSA1/START domain
MTACALPPALVLERVFRASPARVWAAWTDPEVLPRWFGPDGFSCRTKEIDLREGGVWRFDMVGPDGTVWPNRHRFTLHRPPEELRFIMDDDGAGEPIRVVVRFEAEGSGTRLVQEMTMPSEAARQQAIAFGALGLGQQTLGKLARELGE